ncbi:hypothetical protein EIN_498720, partial [Entamoeba invadens IP1]
MNTRSKDERKPVMRLETSAFFGTKIEKGNGIVIGTSTTFYDALTQAEENKDKVLIKIHQIMYHKMGEREGRLENIMRFSGIIDRMMRDYSREAIKKLSEEDFAKIAELFKLTEEVEGKSQADKEEVFVKFFRKPYAPKGDTVREIPKDESEEEDKDELRKVECMLQGDESEDDEEE